MDLGYYCVVEDAELLLICALLLLHVKMVLFHSTKYQCPPRFLSVSRFLALCVTMMNNLIVRLCMHNTFRLIATVNTPQ